MRHRSTHQPQASRTALHRVLTIGSRPIATRVSSRHVAPTRRTFREDTSLRALNEVFIAVRLGGVPVESEGF
uniref:Transposase n=1 Tax=Ascaris lumbricoides TaxID=6252 RepID=A0A0M3HPY1_ASCLU